VADKLSEALGRAVVMENVTGAAGNIAMDRVAKAAPDGHVLLLGSSGPIVVNPAYQKFGYDPIKDLTPISQICFQPNVLMTNNDVPVKNVQDLVAFARSRPGKLSFASGGAGTTNHLAGELLKAMARIDIR